MRKWGRAKAIIGKEAAIPHAKQERVKFSHFGGFTVILSMLRYDYGVVYSCLAPMQLHNDVVIRHWVSVKVCSYSAEHELLFSFSALSCCCRCCFLCQFIFFHTIYT